MVGDMLAYAIDTKTFAVGVGDGDPVGDGLAPGDGEIVGPGLVTAALCEQPPVPTIAAATTANAASTAMRNEDLDSDIEHRSFL
jgi:hypothetical protein